MCGIVGWRSFGTTPIDKAVLKRMNDAISHRGPDSDGIFIDNGIGLAMRRLAIIDLSPKGNQPMTTTTGKSTIVFNGEIYNYQTLRQSSELSGFRFRSATDTEGVMALYERKGTKCVDYLRGMFAFAIWDHEKKRLFIARDRLGKKPLLYYYNKEQGIFLFGSELKSFLVHPALANRTVDEQALRLYLQFGYVPHPWTIFKEVRKLPPGHTLTLEADGTLIIKQYWDVDFNTKTVFSRPTAESEIRNLVEESVRLRMIADVPLGAFLSGGIDSSAVVAYMAKAAKESGAKVKTFSVGFGEERYNELAYAKLVAEKYATDHREITLTPDFIKDMPRITAAWDEPFADASSIPTWYIARETRKHVTVALNGDGGDENFAGYTRYANGMRARFIRLPPMPRTTLPRTGNARIVELLGMSNESRYYSLHTMLAQEHVLLERDKLLTKPFKHYYMQPKELLDKWLYTDIKTYLPDDLLVKVDIATMANSLEGRSPLLDHKLVEFSASLPTKWKLENGQTKSIFKSAMRDIVPDDILTKPKQGFAVPINEWMTGELGNVAHDALLQERQGSVVSSMLDKQKIARLFDQHKIDKQQGYRLWNLLMLKEWEKRMVP